MAVGSISVVAPIAAVAAVVPVVFGIATGDDVSSVQLAGFAFALGGVALASFERPEGGSARVAAGVPWALAAVIGFGGYYVPMHEASGEDFLWAAFTFRLSVFVLVLAAWLVFRPPLGAARKPRRDCDDRLDGHRGELVLCSGLEPGRGQRRLRARDALSGRHSRASRGRPLGARRRAPAPRRRGRTAGVVLISAG